MSNRSTDDQAREMARGVLFLAGLIAVGWGGFALLGWVLR